MAEIPRIQHVPPTPSVVHHTHRVHKPDDRPDRRHAGHGDPEHEEPPHDAVELHEENPAVPAPHRVVAADEEGHLDFTA